MQQRKDTAANWVTQNPILANGEIGEETDTTKFKIGNGSSPWNALVYSNAGTYQSTPVFTSNAYTIQASDAANILFASNAGVAGVIYVPTNASVAFPIQTQIYIQQTGAGQLNIQATTPGTTTITSIGATPASPLFRAQYSSAALIKTGTDSWTVIGDVI